MKCFVIMPFSDPEGYEVNHFSIVYDYLIEPAVKKAGFEPVRVDKNNQSELIALSILKDISSSEMVLCDVSSKNPNVMYELGIRHALDLPVTIIKDEKTTDIFDIKDIRYVPYSSSLRRDKAIEDEDKIAQNLLNTYNSSKNSDGAVKTLMSLINVTSTDLILPSNIAQSEDDKDISETEYSHSGYVVRWHDDKNIGLIKGETDEYFTSNLYLVNSEKLHDNQKVYFLPLPELKEGKNPPAACVIGVGDIVEGIIRHANRFKYFCFTEVTDKYGNTQRLFVEIPHSVSDEELDEFKIGAKILFEVSENQRGVRGINSTISKS